MLRPAGSAAGRSGPARRLSLDDDRGRVRRRGDVGLDDERGRVRRRGDVGLDDDRGRVRRRGVGGVGGAGGAENEGGAGGGEHGGGEPTTGHTDAPGGVRSGEVGTSVVRCGRPSG